MIRSNVIEFLNTRQRIKNFTFENRKINEMKNFVANFFVNKARIAQLEFTNREFENEIVRHVAKNHIKIIYFK